MRAWLLMLVLAAPAVGAEGPPCSGAVGPSAAWQGKGASFVIQAGPGSVQKHSLTIVNGEARTGADVIWDAGDLLTGSPATPPVPAPEARKIYTSFAGSTLPFTWMALPPQLRDLLDADGQGEARTAYVRGDRRREIGQPDGLFRKRVTVLGDIVHSVPLIGGSGTAVYVGANDGMLHAFSAADGTELFAYVPAALVAALPALSDPAAPARPYVDASAGQGDAYIGGRRVTVLASGMGMGARGVFALDITDPAAFANGLGALWEFTEKDDPAIGHVQAAPQIAKLKTGTGERYFAVVSGTDALFLLALDKPAAQRWRAGVNYYRLSTSGGDKALSAPALVMAGDGSATLAYAGDLQGRLWRFDLAAKTAQRLFTARDDAGRAQPIAQAPRAVFAPGGGYLVLFGTGKLSEPADFLPSSYSPQSMYAILDRLEVPAEPVRSRAQLARRVLSGQDSYTVSGERLDYFAPGAKRGWYADFRNDGERVAASPSIAGGSVIFNTVLPGPNACAAAASRLYVLDVLSGLVMGADGRVNPDALIGELTQMVTMLPPPLLIETIFSVGPVDATGAATATRGFVLVWPAPAGAAQPASKAVRFTVRFPARRMGWREVANWQDLHDAAKK